MAFLDALPDWLISCFLLTLRIAPTLAFAPPFTLVQVPPTFRILVGFGLSICLVSANPQAMLADTAAGGVIVAGVRELAFGVAILLVFQLAFGALYLAGRTIDIQAGYGLALLIDPTSRAQMPLTGTLFAYAAAAIFFAMNGHIELFRFLSASLQAVPLGIWSMPGSIGTITSFMSLIFLTAFGVAGASVLALFLVDMTIALLSRTVPQMNMLVLGFQVKTIVFLLVLPISFGVGGALLARMMAMSLQALPKLF